jgi:molybdenum cofactor biosynthesis enzyme
LSESPKYAAKRTVGLIPMCHPEALSFIDISYSLCEDGVNNRCEALETGIEIRYMELQRKCGGKSGD